ncbi:MAG: DNA primase [Candidatus Ryanbacteria bacterium]|nr:DNA primase [Candidatus Ryanbacteria bacterium]
MSQTSEIKSRLDIISLVSGYLKLEKSGINFKACCPFHSEKTPSFYVSPARDSWHCFGCGKGGDIFAFVMEIDGIEFPEALRLLAERTGIVLQEFHREEYSEKSRLLALVEDAAKFFESNLAGAADVRNYLTERGMLPESIAQFRVGFAPDSWRVAGEYLARKGYTAAEIDKAGLSVQGSRGPYDRFRSRIIFPLEDATGRVIGFGGRIFGEASKSAEAAKYINTPQTPLYDKSRFLYGLGKAKSNIHHQKRAVIVEGYMDCIMSHQAGITNTVAVSGTALTESHLGALRRLTDTAVFSFDVDAAGVEASRRAVGLAHKHDFHVRIVPIEGGKDPADIVVQSPERWREFVEGSVESIAFFLKRASAGLSPSDPIAKKKIGEQILPLVADLPNEIEKSHWVSELSRVLGVREDALWRELGKYKAGSTEVPAFTQETRIAPEVAQSRKAKLEERMAGYLLLEPQLALLGDLPERHECALVTTAEIFSTLTKRSSSATIEEILGELPEDVRGAANRYLLEAEILSGHLPDRSGEFTNLLHAWRELSIKDKLMRLREEITELERVGDREASNALMAEFQTLTTHLATAIHHLNYGDQKNKKEKR